jgi:hypothetical protein
MYEENSVILIFIICIGTRFIRAIKSRRITRAGHVAHISERRNPYTILIENLKRRNQIGEKREDDNIKVKFKQIMMV